MISSRNVYEMLHDPARARRYIVVTTDGTVHRHVVITDVTRMNRREVIDGHIEDPSQPDPSANRRPANIPLDEIFDWLPESEPAIGPFSVQLYQDAAGRSFVGLSRDISSFRTYGYTLAIAIDRLTSQKYVNPPDCLCNYDHCSAVFCHSVVPSFGAVPEERRLYPVLASA